jgi:hypothetical protein
VDDAASTEVASLTTGDRAAVGRRIGTHFFGTLGMIATAAREWRDLAQPRKLSRT